MSPDCPAIHYNILVSNCGSCSTHTTVTCTDIPTNGSQCTLAVQTVVCGNITGNISDPINITYPLGMNNSDPTENPKVHNSDTNTVNIIYQFLSNGYDYQCSDLACNGTVVHSYLHVGHIYM